MTKETIEKLANLPLREWEFMYIIDKISAYDYEAIVKTKVDGETYTAIGLYSLGELVKVTDILGNNK